METENHNVKIPDIDAAGLPESIVDAQVQRLLEVVDSYRNQAIDLVQKQVDQHVRLIIQQAYHQARIRLRQDIQDSRKQMEKALNSARAKQHTFIMQQQHQSNRKYLDQSWQLLEKKLLTKWKDPNLRSSWTGKIAYSANSVLAAKDWLVEYPESWLKKERDVFDALVKQKCQRQLQFEERSFIAAGIRISADNAIVDGTLNGLLSDRGRIESEFLAQCSECIVHSHGAEKT